MAAANSLIDTVTFYKRVGESGEVYETTPSFSIEGNSSRLNYPHDIAFSRDGLHFAVANRLGNSITIYKKDPSGDHFNNTPIAILRGYSSGVKSPDSVRYSPTENILAVANLKDSSIAFYHYDGDVYDRRPYFVLRDKSTNLKVPDSIDFSKDGELLATTSHDLHSLLIYQRIPNSNGFYTSSPVEIIEGPATNFNYPHSVSFHPTNDYLIVTSSQGEKNVNIFRKVSDEFPRYDHVPFITLEIKEMYDESNIYLLDQLQQEGGCKGVSFSPDGNSFAVTQNLCMDDLVLPVSVGVLLIYPIHID